MTLFDLTRLIEERNNLQKEMEHPDFWNDQKRALFVVNLNNKYKEKIDEYQRLEKSINDLDESLILLKEQYDEEIQNIVESELNTFNQDLEKYQISVLLSSEFDDCNAILEFHPGAGGTESQDWAEMLYRMYVRYAEAHRFKMQSIYYEVGDEAGIKSASLIIKGKNAFGYLKGEKGIHRLVRISPFDSSGRRHTSFASVDVIPEVNDTTEIQIEEKDLKIDTYRSSGAGGQNVNKTESAVRITHIPTGIVVNCQNERSQIQNREIAMQILKSRLYQKMVNDRQKELDKLRGEQKNIEWGSQIRSYVFCPYTMVKDHRTNCESGDVFKVLEGELDTFIFSYLKMEAKQNG